MRIDKLYLQSFRNLREFEIDFDEESPRTVLIGRNGTGKTNVLEALVAIFRQLDLQIKPEFAYRIRYKCNSHLVEIESSLDSDGRFRMRYGIADATSTGTKVESISESSFHKLNSQVKTRLLPRHVVGYYSGSSNRFVEPFREYTRTYRDRLIKNLDDNFRTFFLAEDWHSRYVLLAFFAAKDADISEFLERHLGITRLDYALTILNEPYWTPSLELKEQGDEHFWWATGAVQQLISDLYKIALAPMRIVEREHGRKTSKENLYCFVKSADDLGLLMSRYIDQKELFNRLESAVMLDFLKSLTIRFRVGQSGDLIGFEDLSEGEQQLLAVLGLLRFTNDDETLFLLDEPDTHLNPAWCLDYLNILKQYGGTLSESQIILTTHNPLVFAGLNRNEVIVMNRCEHSGAIEAKHPDSSPKGMGFAAILTSEFFGLRSALDRETAALLDEKRRLGAIEGRTRAQEQRLIELNCIIGGLDFTQTVADPLFTDFVKAMTDREVEEPNIAVPVLGPNALELRRKRAAEALAQVRKQGSADEAH
jgi:predicted ATPase